MVVENSLDVTRVVMEYLAKLDFADLGRIAGDADQAIDEPVGIFLRSPGDPVTLRKLVRSRVRGERERGRR